MSATDDEKPLAERDVEALDALLAAIPDDRDPMDVAVLDGYLAGVLLQPDPIPPSSWLPLVFDADGREGALPDPETARRATELIMRRYNELAACIAAREPFDPIVFEATDDAGVPLAGRAGIAALAPWAAGFVVALDTFPALDEACDRDGDLDALIAAIARYVELHPEATDDERGVYADAQAVFDHERPLANLDDALDDVVDAVLDIADISRPNRPVTRAAPKVGRNDPCPCGSGRKYKACHGSE